MLMVSIEEFARTGRFGPIQLGVTRDTLRSIIGYPDCWSGSDANSLETASIWKFGDIEFYFDVCDRLYMVYADNFDVPSGGNAFSIEPWVVRMCCDVDVFKDALRSGQITFSVETLPSYLPGQIEIKTIGDVVFRFQIEAKDEFDRLGLLAFWVRKDIV